jgi:hypothetical protein
VDSRAPEPRQQDDREGDNVALNLGGIIRLTYAVKNDLGVLVNPTTATLTIIQPDGTTAAGTTVTLPPAVTGNLVYDFTTTQAGLHSVHWATTVPSTAEDDLFIAERPASMLVSVDEAVAHLRASGVLTSDSDREQLQWLCSAATDAVERDLGRVFTRRTFTEVYDGGDVAIVLRQSPVISITSVTDSAVGLSAADYTLDPATGILYRGSTSSYWTRFTTGRQSVTVTYVAGYTDPPRVARMVALSIVQSMWQTSQQASHPLLEESADLAIFSAAGSLNSYLQRAYDSLRAPAVA